MNEWQWFDFAARWALICLWFCWALYTHKRLNRLEMIGVKVTVERAVSDITNSIEERKH